MKQVLPNSDSGQQQIYESQFFMPVLEKNGTDKLWLSFIPAEELDEEFCYELGYN